MLSLNDVLKIKVICKYCKNSKAGTKKDKHAIKPTKILTCTFWEKETSENAHCPVFGHDKAKQDADK